MSKRILVDALVGPDKFATKKEAERAIDVVTDGIAALAAAGERINLRGFGNFQMKERAGRTGTLNGVQISIPAKTVLFFSDRIDRA